MWGNHSTLAIEGPKRSFRGHGSINQGPSLYPLAGKSSWLLVVLTCARFYGTETVLRFLLDYFLTPWPPHRDVTAVLKLLIKCFVEAQIYSRRTDIGSSITFQRPYGNPYLFLWKQTENHCIWRLLVGGVFFLSNFLSSWLQLFFKWRCAWLEPLQTC